MTSFVSGSLNQLAQNFCCFYVWLTTTHQKTFHDLNGFIWF